MMYTKLEEFKLYLIREEKSQNTIEKYERDTKKFLLFLNNCEDNLSIEQCILYKKQLMREYEYVSVNSMLNAMNQFLTFIGRRDCVVKLIKIQKLIFQKEERVMSKTDYTQLVGEASRQGKERLILIMETLAGTGIRISELQFFDVQSLKNGVVTVDNKGKARTVFIPHKLQLKLLLYIKKQKIKNGQIFVTKGGKAVDRSNVWKELKHLAKAAGITLSKVFPQNFRHLFAVTFYQFHKDIVQLADLLGHSSINTTRIYTITSGKEHEKKINQLGLIPG